MEPIRHRGRLSAATSSLMVIEGLTYSTILPAFGAPPLAFCSTRPGVAALIVAAPLC